MRRYDRSDSKFFLTEDEFQLRLWRWRSMRALSLIGALLVAAAGCIWFYYVGLLTMWVRPGMEDSARIMAFSQGGLIALGYAWLAWRQAACLKAGPNWDVFMYKDGQFLPRAAV